MRSMRMSLFFLRAEERMPMPPVRLEATAPPVRPPTLLTNLRRVIMLNETHAGVFKIDSPKMSVADALLRFFSFLSLLSLFAPVQLSILAWSVRRYVAGGQ